MSAMKRRTVVTMGAFGPALMLALAVPARAGEAHVTIDNFSFNPAQLTVPAGTRVTWTNRDDIPHTVVDAGDPRAFRSPALDTDDTFAFEFATPGTRHYFCSLHPHMRGTIVVT
jgi:plastocyanin